MRKRNNVVFVRFDDEEYAALRAKIEECSMTISSYIINTALGRTILPRDAVNELKEQTKLLKDIDLQLRGMGTNVNQMAHIANAREDVPDIGLLNRYGNEVRDLKEVVNQIWRSIRLLISQQRHTGV